MPTLRKLVNTFDQLFYQIDRALEQFTQPQGPPSGTYNGGDHPPARYNGGGYPAARLGLMNSGNVSNRVYSMSPRNPAPGSQGPVSFPPPHFVGRPTGPQADPNPNQHGQGFAGPQGSTSIAPGPVGPREGRAYEPKKTKRKKKEGTTYGSVSVEQLSQPQKEALRREKEAMNKVLAWLPMGTGVYTQVIRELEGRQGSVKRDSAEERWASTLLDIARQCVFEPPESYHSPYIPESKFDGGAARLAMYKEFEKVGEKILSSTSPMEWLTPMQQSRIETRSAAVVAAKNNAIAMRENNYQITPEKLANHKNGAEVATLLGRPIPPVLSPLEEEWIEIVKSGDDIGKSLKAAIDKIIFEVNEE